MVRDTRRGVRLQFDTLENREVPALVGLDQLAVDATDYDPNHVLVKWNTGLGYATRYTQRAEPLGGGLFRLTLKPNFTVPQALSALSASQSIVLLQPDYRIQVTATPNDLSVGTLWGLHNTGQNGGTADADIDAPEAWNTSTGTKRTVVAVIDTGVDFTHPDLRNNIWRNVDEIPGNGIDDDRNGFRDDVYGYDFANNDANPMDDNGHGTHVAGTIGAVGNNGIGIAGVNWNTQIMPLKFLNANGSGYLSNAVRALNYAIANGAKVINMSFGGGGYDAAMATAINTARARGIILVAAAGNSAGNNDVSPVYPANYASDNLITVAASDRNDRLASFSNYGRSTVDIAAPGVSIYSTLPGGRYGSYSGTSMAAPHVAGAAALVWDAHPTWTYRQVLDAILRTTDAVPGLANRTARGRLNVAGAINYGVATPPPPPVVTDTAGAAVTGVEFTGTGSAISQARVTFSEAINPTTFTTSDVKLTGPGGRVVAISGVRVVAGSGNKQFDVTFASQSAAGSYTLAVGPDIRDVTGNMMDQNRNGRNGEAVDKFSASTAITSAQTFASANVGQPILDFRTVVSRLTITKDITISDLNVSVNASHTYVGDIRLTLVAPDGTRVILFNRRGGSGDNLVAEFDDEGANSIYRGVAPFSGGFKPEYVLSAFDGKSAKGTWQLIIEDTALFDWGRLNAWSLTIEGTTKAASVSSASATTQPPAAPPVDEYGRVHLGLSSYFVRL